MEISSFQRSEHNQNGAPDMVRSKFGPNYELLKTTVKREDKIY